MIEQAELFAAASLPKQSKRPQEPIARDALIVGTSRMWLKRAWGAGPMILWAGANPSDADGLRDDPTMWRVMEFSAAWGFGSCVMINPIPHISSTPAAALEWVKRAEEWMIDGDLPTPEWEVYQHNLSVWIEQIDRADAYVAAWGNIVPPDFMRRWLQDVAEAVENDYDSLGLKPVEWLCLGTNSNGSPRHPLSRGKNRVPADFKPVPWKLS